jgi:hypothetical protein
MARISVVARADGRTVRIHGTLRASDLQRLEHACGPALEQRTPRLEIVIRGPVVTDGAAVAYLAHLHARGVTIRATPDQAPLAAS